jgi:hypothetical protein
VTAAEPLPLAKKAALVAEVVGAYAYVRWHLWRREFPDALRSIRAVDGVRQDGIGDDRLARGVRRTLRLLPGDTRCLAQSLVLTRLLARRGRLSRLVIGVAPGAAFGAHAWVERDDVPLLPSHGRQFERLAEL